MSIDPLASRFGPREAPATSPKPEFGPWIGRHLTDGNTPTIYPETAWRIEDSRGHCVAVVAGSGNAEANTRLMVAAPDLLDAARAALELLRSIPLDARPPAAVDRDQQLVAAILAAVGEPAVCCQVCRGMVSERQR